MLPWQLLLWKWVKDIFTMIIVMVAKWKKMLQWVIPCQLSRACQLYLMDFIEICTSGRYHREIKILEILAANSKWFRDYDIFKKWQIDDDMGEASKYNNFFDNFCLKQPLVLKILLGMAFDSRNSKMTLELP